MGRYQHAVDSKGRIFVPSKIREDLGKSVYVTRSLDSACLSGYTPEQFGYIREQFAALSGTDPVVRQLRREILGEAILCDMDSQGRISVTDELWASIGVPPGSSVYIIYLFDKFEIWPVAEYDQQRKLVADKLEEDLSRYDIRGI